MIDPIEHLASHRSHMLRLVSGAQVLNRVTLQDVIRNHKFPASPEQQTCCYHGSDRQGLQGRRRVSCVRLN